MARPAGRRNSSPGPDKKKVIISLSIVLIVVTLLTGVLASFKGNPYEQAMQENPSSSREEQEESQDGSVPDADMPSSEADGEQTSSGDAGPDSGTDEEEEMPVYYNIPSEMRAVQIAAGRDYMTTEDVTSATLASQIDQALSHAQELTMNSIIIDTKYNDAVLFSSSFLPQAQVELDCVDYLAGKAKEMGFYVYATYDVSDLADISGQPVQMDGMDGDTLDFVAASVAEFAEKYEFDGILLDDYYYAASPESYGQYAISGGGMGYENYARQVPLALVNTAQSAIRKAAPGTQVGLLTDAVWENQDANERGSETSAEFTMLSDGNADVVAMLESGKFDFVMVRNFDSTTDPNAPFRTVAQWWKDITDPLGITLYTMHANERLGVEPYGWQVMEQLSKQVIDLNDMSVGSGSAFHSLAALVADPGGTTTTLVQYMNDEIDETYVLQQLSISKPTQLTYTTQEPTVTFQGASDPREEVTINGEAVPRNESGYFTIREDLKEGLNTFAISHKNKTFTYNITREIIVLKEIQPVGAISVDGGMAITVNALAYEGSTVTASIGNQQITLSPSETEGDETDGDSGYQMYVGVFTAPSASETATQMGTIQVTAVSQDGHSTSLTGATVTVNKRVEMGDGVVVSVVAEQAETFPTNTLDNISHADYFPLPQGTVDRAYGSEIIYKSGKETYSFWNLQSGVRVYSSDITTGGQMPDNNAISDMSVKSSGAYTTVSLTTGSKVPYKVQYDGSKLVFQFEYTATVPESQTLKDNALFQSATWSGSNLTLTLNKSGGFLGYKAYYESATKLVLRFNNSPGSLSGARIVVDPGHGGNDPGALGFYPGKDEADINLAIAKKLVSELKSQGATVLQVNPGSTMASRLEAARAFNPQVLVSVHCNTNGNASAKGTEVYYFYPFQKQLAANISANVANTLGTTNRGAKAGLYYMTREAQFTCVLAEIGFISNEEEYTRLITSKYQSSIAQAIASGVRSYLSGTSSGGGYSEDKQDSDDDLEDDEISGLTLDESVLDMEIGDTYVLEADWDGDQDADIDWDSEDPSIASVNASGKVTARAKGTTYIIAKVGGRTAECEVNVETTGSGKDVTGVSLDQEELELGVGDTYNLTATVRPSTASNKSVTWESDDEDVATVSSSGKVTAREEGKAYITVRTKDGDYWAECEVVVGKRDNSGGLVTKIKISGEESVEISRRIELTAEVTPYNAQDPGVKWLTDDDDLILISNMTDSSCKVEGLKNGIATVTAQAYDDGKVTATFKIKVGTGVSSDNDDDDDDEDDVTPQKGVLVDKIEISGSSSIKTGTRNTYTAKVTPAYAEDPGVKWSVSNSDILEISTYDDESCKVEGLKKGTAYLIGTAYDDGKVSTRFKIQVN